MPVEDEFVEVGGLLGGQAMESLVIEDGQVGRKERPEGAVCRVVRSGLCHSFEEVVGVDETDIVSGADGSVAQGLSEEALADTCRSHQEDVLAPVEKLQGEDGVQQTAIRIASNPMVTELRSYKVSWQIQPRNARYPGHRRRKDPPQRIGEPDWGIRPSGVLRLVGTQCGSPKRRYVNHPCGDSLGCRRNADPAAFPFRRQRRLTHPLDFPTASKTRSRSVARASLAACCPDNLAQHHHHGPPTYPWRGYRTLHTAKSIGIKPSRLFPLPLIPCLPDMTTSFRWIRAKDITRFFHQTTFYLIDHITNRNTSYFSVSSSGINSLNVVL